MYQLSDKELRIEAARGVLIVMDSQNQPHRINEASMADFERFYALWSVAMQLAGDETFLNAWCFVDGFKSTLTEALQVIGFKHPGAFSPSQLEALLISYEENGSRVFGGILFKFHQTYPKLTQKAMKTPGTTSGNQPRKPMTLTLPEFMPIKNLMAIARAKLGHFLESCATWLLTNSPRSQQTPNDGKKLSTTDGPQA